MTSLARRTQGIIEEIGYDHTDCTYPLIFYKEKSMLENIFKTKLKKELELMLPGCIVLHMDANDIQGIPDLLVLHEHTWFALEGKKNKTSPFQPNQEWWVNHMDEMSFGMVIYPENKEEVLYEIQQTCIARGATCILKP